MMASGSRIATAATAALALACVLGACASLPVSGRVQQVDVGQGAGGPAPATVNIVPKPPGQDWNSNQIVQGFFTASASDDRQVALQYLAPQYRAQWKPGPTSTTIIVQLLPSIQPPLTGPAEHIEGPSVSVNTYTLRTLATLSSNGVYRISPSTTTYTLGLSQVAGRWRIDRLPAALKDEYLLTEADFERDYQPTNLYFTPGFASTSTPVPLVPDPVYLLNRASAKERVTTLVNDLLRPPDDWLAGASATSSAFPTTSTLARPVTVNGGTARVDLGGGADQALGNKQELETMAAQLAWTLTGSSYGSPPAVQGVHVEIDGKPLPYAGTVLVQDSPSYANWVPQPSSPAYFIAAGRLQSTGGAQSTPLTLPPGVTPDQVNAIAVSPRHGFLGCTSRAVYAGPLGSARPPARTTQGPPGCQSLSWDGQSNLWAASAGQVWVRPDGTSRFSRIAGPSMTGSASVALLRVAPDGVRAAMIVVRSATRRNPVRTPELVVAAIGPNSSSSLPSLGQAVSVGPGVPDPVAVDWLDADHLLVLSRAANGGQQLWIVPLNGGPGSQVSSPPPGTNSIAVTGAGQGVAGVGGSGGAPGQIWTASASQRWNWTQQAQTDASQVFPACLPRGH